MVIGRQLVAIRRSPSFGTRTVRSSLHELGWMFRHRMAEKTMDQWRSGTLLAATMVSPSGPGADVRQLAHARWTSSSVTGMKVGEAVFGEKSSSSAGDVDSKISPYKSRTLSTDGRSGASYILLPLKTKSASTALFLLKRSWAFLYSLALRPRPVNRCP